MKIKVYLAGYVGESEFRKKFKEVDIIDAIDPIEQSKELYRDIFNNYNEESVKKIVENDKKLILESDLLIAYIRIGPTAGTSMEIMYAFEHNIPVYIIDPTGRWKTDIWYNYHATRIFKSNDECIEFFENQYWNNRTKNRITIEELESGYVGKDDDHFEENYY